jgi:EAL domain-containing protein (putative c-di-GMP-specific phosphodiesterase class I)
VADVLNPGASGRLETRGRIDYFLKGRGLTHLFQPVFDLTSGKCFAVEALARFSGQPRRTPDVWFAEAHAMGAGVDLEVVSVKKALVAMSRLPPGIAMCVNAGPEATGSDEVRQLVAACDSRRVVMELTEQVKVDDYPQLSHALKQLRLMGVRLAIDDTGAGFASLAHILKLAPDLIKLDRELTSGIDRDPVRCALAAALVSFASQTGWRSSPRGSRPYPSSRYSEDLAFVTDRDFSSVDRHRSTRFPAVSPDKRSRLRPRGRRKPRPDRGDCEGKRDRPYAGCVHPRPLVATQQLGKLGPRSSRRRSRTTGALPTRRHVS